MDDLHLHLYLIWEGKGFEGGVGEWDSSLDSIYVVLSSTIAFECEYKSTRISLYDNVLSVFPIESLASSFRSMDGVRGDFGVGHRVDGKVVHIVGDTLSGEFGLDTQV